MMRRQTRDSHEPPPSRKATGGMPDVESGSKTAKTPREELYKLWRELVQKQRMHEMVKCLLAEKQKLKILHSNLEGGDEFLEFAAQHHAAKAEAHKHSVDVERKKSEAEEATEEAEPTTPRGTVTVERGSLPTSDRLDSQTSSTQFDASSRDNLSSRRKTHIGDIIDHTKITDQDFEDIVELCEDKVEQKALREAYEQKKARETYLHGARERRVMVYNFINSQFFTNFMLLTIITSIVGIFLMTFESIAIRYAWPLIMLDSCIIGIFLVEAILKVYIYKKDYFHKLWNLLDLLIIIIHFMEVSVDLVTRTLALSTDINSYITFKFLKSLRALRLLRVIKFLPNLQVIVATVFQSMLSIGSIAVLMLLFIFVFAVMGRGLFFERKPDNFGNLWLSFVTLFQLLTLDDWFELLESEGSSDSDDVDITEYQTTIEDPDTIGYWILFTYLFAYLVIEFFVFLNLFVAVLVDNFQLTLADAEIQKQKELQEQQEALQKFENMKDEGIEAILTEEEHLQQLSEVQQLGMYVDEYFPVEKDSREAELLAEFYKDLNSLDFQRFLWKRRHTLFNMITDSALNSRQSSLNNPDVGDNEDEDNKDAAMEAELDGNDDDEEPLPRKPRKTRDLSENAAWHMNEVTKEYLPSRYSLTDQTEKNKFVMGENEVYLKRNEEDEASYF